VSAPVGRRRTVTLLYVHALSVADRSGRRLLDRIELHLDPGQTLGLAGGRASGKTLLCLALAGALPDGLAIAGGRVLLGNRDLAAEPWLNDGVLAFGFDGQALRGAMVALYDEPESPPPRPARDTAAIVTGPSVEALARQADEIAVLCAGRLVERGPSAEVLAAPRHPYTEALIEGRANAHTASVAAEGCRWRTACTYPIEDCAGAASDLQMVSAERMTACIRWRALWGFR
jgi:ABC-type glutathione transport system ATPase component